MTDRPATVYFAERRIALDELYERGARAAQALSGQGIGPGDVIPVLLHNEPAFVEALTCLRCLDAVLVLIPWHLTAAEMRPILAAVEPKALIVHADLLPRVLACAAELPALRLAVIDTPPEVEHAYDLPRTGPRPAFPGLIRWEALIERATAALPIPLRSIQAIAVTSGSTGAPKIIRREGRPRWIRWAAHCTDSWPAIHRSIVAAPLYHTGQYGVFSQACHQGADAVILPRFEPEAFLQAVEQHRVNHAYLHPPMFGQLLQLPTDVRARYDVSSLDYVVQTGAPCPPQVKRAMIEWLGPVIWEVYGTSETSTIAACSSREWLTKPTTVGRPLRRVVILDGDGRACPPGRTGEIYVDVSDMPRISYQNGAVNRRRIDGAEFISTGDVGALDEEGDLSVCGRTDDVISNGRLKVYPEEIEHAILRHPRVRDCAVFGIPDAVNGQAIAAIVTVTDGDPDIEAELRAFLREWLSDYKIPVRIWSQAQPLRTEAGKLNRNRLTDRVELAGAP